MLSLDSTFKGENLLEKLGCARVKTSTLEEPVGKRIVSDKRVILVSLMVLKDIEEEERARKMSLIKVIYC